MPIRDWLAFVYGRVRLYTDLFLLRRPFGRWTEALGAYGEAVLPSQDREGQRWLQVARGIALWKAGRAAEAASYLEAAEGPETTLYRHIAWYWEAQGDLERALRILRQGERLAERADVLYLSRIELLRRAGRMEEAVALAEQARTRFPRSGPVRWYAAEAALELEHPELAAESAAEAVDLEPQWPDPYLTLAELLLYRQDELQAETLETLPHLLGTAWHLDPDHPGTLHVLSRFRFRDQDPEEAQAALVELRHRVAEEFPAPGYTLFLPRKRRRFISEILPVPERPRPAIALLAAADLLVEFGQPEKALHFYERALEREPEYGLLHYRIGLLYCSHLEAFEKAREHLERYLALDPQGPEWMRKRAQELLQSLHQKKPRKARSFSGISWRIVDMAEFGEEHLTGVLETSCVELATLRDVEEQPATYLREGVLEELYALLQRPDNSSFVLVGEPGVGKTAVIYELARRLKRGHCPPALTGYRIFETTTQNLMAGTKYIGEWETKLVNLTREMREAGDVILYIRDLPNIVGAGTTSTSSANFASYLAPLIERGEITVIGEATADMLKHMFRQAPYLERVFTQVRLEEPRAEELDRILMAVARDLGQRYGVEILPEVVQRIIELTGRFLPYQKFPGKAIDFLKQMLARLAHRGQLAARQVLTAEVVVSQFQETTGLPAVVIDDRARLDLDEVHRFFSERVLGQEEAVEAIKRTLALLKSGLHDPSRPLATYLCLGPTGVGKTEFAKTVAAYLFGSPERMVRLDMSEYMEWNSWERLIGERFDDRGGKLTRPIQEQPFSVVLLDEFEKCHPNVYDLLLQVFDEGRLTDRQGRTTDFRNTIIIMTSNIGSKLYGQKPIGFEESMSDEALRRAVQAELERYFRPEFLNRIELIYFKPLSAEVVRRIAYREIGKVIAREGILRKQLTVEIDERLVDRLIEEGYSPRYGARFLKRAVERLITLPLAQALVERSIEPGSMIRLESDPNGQTRVHVEPPAGPAALPEPGRLPAMPDPDELERELEELERRLQALADRQGVTELRRRIQELEARMQEPTFWDHPRQALEELRSLGQCYRIQNRYRRLEQTLEELKRLHYRREKTLWPELTRLYREAVLQMEALEWEQLLAYPEASADALLWLEPTGPESETWALELGLAYRQALEGRGLEVIPMAEDPHSGLLLLVRGHNAYGLLLPEAGVHRLLRDSGTPAEVRIRISPFPPTGGGERPEVRFRPLRRRVQMSTGLEARYRMHVRDPQGRTLSWYTDRPKRAWRPYLAAFSVLCKHTHQAEQVRIFPLPDGSREALLARLEEHLWAHLES
jgi:ATP-dependent Clp protease ATP-binding subunit ClpC|nr:MAG: hypothetical protein KatS3mg041_1806 [Bacteroidota bacterium]